MTPKTYLNQAYRLEQRIRLDTEELEDLRTLAATVSSPGFEEHYNPNHPTDAPFVKTLERIWEMEQKVNDELDLLLQLKDEVQSVIAKIDNKDERLILTYRYLKNYTWARIGEELYADERTIRRWHDRALSHVVVPENPVVL